MPFEKALVHRTAEGIPIEPLYTERPAAAERLAVPGGARFRICMRAEAGEVAEQLEGGADAVWLRAAALDDERVVGLVKAKGASVVVDATASRQNGPIPCASLVEASGRRVLLASTLEYHAAGADAVDEVALALATVAELLRGGLDAEIGAQVAAGRDTFVELAKLRALRVCWRKLLAAAGLPAGPPVVHAVCSSRTLAQRDPWVNMLRVTTQVFAAVLGGADLVTPASFDQALGAPGDLGRRVARNTGLVLREESALGKVRDPAAGSYYLEAVTDAVAREAWKRFQTIEREGGVADAVASGRLRERLDAKWRERLDAVAKRKTPLLGVSDFANLDEKLPQPAHADAVRPGGASFAARRDTQPFEDLRLRAEALPSRPEAVLVTLGPLAESRPRVGFATNFFAAGGIRSRETSKDEPAKLACLCGSDERYAAEAVARARALKAAGCTRVLLAGRPGALEPALREAGVDAFLYVGCDTVAILSELLEALR